MQIYELVDNIVLMKEHLPPIEFINSGGRPVEYLGINYNPRFSIDARVIGYQAKVKNLIIYIGWECAWLKNSIHKYKHGGNWNDLYRPEIILALTEISEITGIDWMDATVKEAEVGCNIQINPMSAVNALVGYKHKRYQPMLNNGTPYGAYTEVKDYYKVKAYNKTFEVQQTDKIRINKNIFRWEIAMKFKHLVRLFGSKVTVREMLEPEILGILANHALEFYINSVKMEQIHFHKLTAHQQLVFAAMQNPQVAENLKIHHREAHKKYRKIYKNIMTDPDICVHSDQADAIREKFEQLMGGIPTCSIDRKEGTFIPK